MIFLMLLDECSSCNLYLWNFMTNLFYIRLLNSFLAKFLGNFDLLMLWGDIEPNPGPSLIPVKASDFATGISIA